MSNIAAHINPQQFNADVKRGNAYVKKLERIDALKGLIAHQTDLLAKLVKIRAPKSVIENQKDCIKSSKERLRKLESWAARPASVAFIRAIAASMLAEIALRTQE